jgi:hypothetical protein
METLWENIAAAGETFHEYFRACTGKVCNFTVGAEKL